MVICLKQSANDLHMVHLMPLSPTISCMMKLVWWNLVLIQVVIEKMPLNKCLSLAIEENLWGLPHVILQTGCPSSSSSNSVKARKGTQSTHHTHSLGKLVTGFILS